MDTETITTDDVLVLATDGLWDVVTNEEVAAIVARGLQAWDNESRAGKYRYISLAQVGMVEINAGMDELFIIYFRFIIFPSHIKSHYDQNSFLDLHTIFMFDYRTISAK